MSQKTLRKKKRRSPERRTPRSARPCVAARSHPARPAAIPAPPGCDPGTSPCAWGNPELRGVPGGWQPFADSAVGDGERCVNGTGRGDAASAGHLYKG